VVADATSAEVSSELDEIIEASRENETINEESEVFARRERVRKGKQTTIVKREIRGGIEDGLGVFVQMKERVPTPVQRPGTKS
jgi:hypothetical protein